MTDAADATVAFINDLTWDRVPEAVRSHVAWLCLDAAAAADSGRRLEGPRLAAAFAREAYGGDQATCLLDGGRVSAPGAAWANGTLMNAVDIDDGHSLAKGHPGAIVIPAALAVAEMVDAAFVDLTTAIVVGYEIAIRAAVQQHDRWPLFHSTATWGALGAAAAAAHLLRLSPDATDAALGLAEYHAPMDLIMRGVAEPTMAKDAMGWGAMVGVSSAVLARSGFSAHRSEFLEQRAADALGERWEILNTYVKPYPCCRWAHPALAAMEALLDELGVAALRPEGLRRLTIRTFQSAASLSRVLPTTSEQAQFNLAFPVAAMAAGGRFDLDSITTGLDDPRAAAIFAKTEIVVDDDLTAEFPRVRRSEVIVELEGGRSHRSGLCSARGDAGDPRWSDVIRAKFPQPDFPFAHEPPDLRLGSATPHQLFHALGYARAQSLNKGEEMSESLQSKRLEAIDGMSAAFRERAPRHDREATFPEENFRDLHAAGLLSLTVPTKWGGCGLWGEGGYVEYYEILEHLASIDSPTAQLLQVHLHGMGMLCHSATEEQARKYIIPMMESGHRVASVGSESTPGKTKSGESTSELTRNADGSWSLTCEKHFASLGPGADYFIIWLAMPGTESYDHRSVAVLVPRHAPEVEMIDNWDTLGMRSTVSWGIRIENYQVPDDAIFGEPGWWETADPRTFTLGFASNHLGAARGALEFTTEWVRARPAMARSEVVQYQLGEMSASLAAGRAALFDAARRWEGEDKAGAEFASVQALTIAKKVALEITQKAFDVCGARSMFKNYPLEQIFRDTRTFTLHYRVDNYTRELGAAMLADGYSIKGNGGIVAAQV